MANKAGLLKVSENDALQEEQKLSPVKLA